MGRIKCIICCKQIAVPLSRSSNVNCPAAARIPFSSPVQNPVQVNLWVRGSVADGKETHLFLLGCYSEFTVTYFHRCE
jgi:hypothetical protein